MNTVKKLILILVTALMTSNGYAGLTDKQRESDKKLHETMYGKKNKTEIAQQDSRITKALKYCAQAAVSPKTVLALTTLIGLAVAGNEIAIAAMEKFMVGSTISGNLGTTCSIVQAAIGAANAGWASWGLGGLTVGWEFVKGAVAKGLSFEAVGQCGASVGEVAFALGCCKNVQLLLKLLGSASGIASAGAIMAMIKDKNANPQVDSKG